MSKIYQHSNNPHRSNVAQAGQTANANAGGNNTNRVGAQNAIPTPQVGQQHPQQTNVPNNISNNGHGHHHTQQQPHHPRQHGHNAHQHQHHHHHHNQQQHHHHQQQQHLPHHHQPQQQQQQQQQQHQHPMPPSQQQHHHNQQHHGHPLSQAYVPHPSAPQLAATAAVSHDVLDPHHHSQQTSTGSTPQQIQQGPGAANPNQQTPQNNQPNTNAIVKHHVHQAQQHTPIASTQMHHNHNHHHPHHQQQQHHHHHHNQQQQQHHHPQLHPYPQQIPISPAVPQPHWVGAHPPPAQSSQQTPHHQQPHHQHHQQPPHQPHQQHHPMTHPQGPHMMLNHQQYPNPNLFYTQLGHPFVSPTGHMQPPPPHYDHHPSTASHHPNSVNINSQPTPQPQQQTQQQNQPQAAPLTQQQPVSISDHHPGNMPITQLTPVISTSTTGTTNVNHINNGPIVEGHMSNRLPLTPQQSPYMMPPYLHHNSPFNLMVGYPQLNMNPYPGSHLPSPSPAMMPPIRVPGDVPIRQPYDLQNQTVPIPPVTSTLAQPPGVPKPAVTIPPPVANVVTPVTPITPTRPREKRAIPIVDPVTKHVYSEAELKGSTASGQQDQASKDSVTPRISPPKDTLISEKESSNIDLTVNTQNTTVETTSPVTATISSPEAPEKPSLINQDNVDSQNGSGTRSSSSNSGSCSTITTQELKSSEPDCMEDTKVVIEQGGEDVTKNGINESKIDTTCELRAKIETITISSDDKHQASEQAAEAVETPVKKKTLLDLPYAAGQYSPLNPNGSRKYSIEFLKAVAKEIGIEISESSKQNAVDHFAPHYIHQPGGNFGGFSTSQTMTRRSSQQAISKPRKVIVTQSLQNEVELKTAEKPWKPELENEKSKIVETGEMDTKRLLKVFRGHLNKLTPQKYDSLIEKINALDLDGPERLSSVIDLVFDKAVDEPGFCELYARMCKVIAAKDSGFCFHLVKKCQDEFETSDIYDGLRVVERQAGIESEVDAAKKKLMSEELYEDMRLRRKKYLGTIKLIGEMYKFGLLLPKIIGLCMNHLISGASNENIECLCSLIATVGAKMASEPSEDIDRMMKNTLDILHKLAHSNKTGFVLESRIKFKILDTIELSRRGWRPRMVEQNPKTLEELHKEDKESRSRQEYQNQQSRNAFKSDDRDRNRRGGPGHGVSPYERGPGKKW